MKRSDGFTVIEIVVAIAFLGVAAFLLLAQKSAIAAGQRDAARKTAVNAMYYDLEEVYYKQHGAYPVKIDSSVLTAMDPALFIDPDGDKINTSKSDYHYDSVDCVNDKCKSYTLKASLEKEADYVKTSRHS